MAIANPASPQAGPQPEPQSEPKSEPGMMTTDTGAERKGALPGAAPPTSSDAGSRVGYATDRLPAVEISRSERELDEPAGSFVAPMPSSNAVDSSDVPGLNPDDSSASHLTGSSVADIQSVDAKFRRLLATIHENRPGDDLEIIRKAWAFCLQQHEGQKRASGEPYIIHPLEVAQVLAELKMDSTAIAAGGVGEAGEEPDGTAREGAHRFGAHGAAPLPSLPTLPQLNFANREDHQAENIRKMLLAMVTDVRVV